MNNLTLYFLLKKYTALLGLPKKCQSQFYHIGFAAKQIYCSFTLKVYKLGAKGYTITYFIL